MKRTPEKCIGCRYFKIAYNNPACEVFTEVLPAGWLRPDGTCMAYRKEIVHTPKPGVDFN